MIPAYIRPLIDLTGGPTVDVLIAAIGALGVFLIVIGLFYDWDGTRYGPARDAPRP